MRSRRSRLAAALAALLLAPTACSSGAPEPPGSARTIGFVFIGDRGDLGYNQAIWTASEELARAFPDTTVLRTGNVPETAAAGEAMESLIDRGASVVFATSFGYRDQAVAVARRHPDVVVLHQGGLEGPDDLDNFGTYWGTVYEPVYEAGIVAGAATRTGRLGFVAAFPIPAVLNNVNAFLLGARSVRRDAVLEVAFTDSWCATVEQRQAAQRLLRGGADVLTQHQDCTKTVLESAESARAFSVGYHADGSEVAPKGYLVGPVWNWGNLLVDIVRTVRQGRFVGSRYDADFRGGLATNDNPFVLSEMSPLVTPRTRALVAAAESRFRGGVSPFTGPVVDRHGRVRVAAGVTPSRAEVDRMDYVVKGVLGRIPGSTA